MDEVLQGGKGGMKRLYQVDEKLYGTQEGVETKKRVEAELAKKRERQKRKKAARGIDGSQKETVSSTTTKSIVGLTVAAVIASVLFGGGRRQ